MLPFEPHPDFSFYGTPSNLGVVADCVLIRNFRNTLAVTDTVKTVNPRVTVP